MKLATGASRVVVILLSLLFFPLHVVPVENHAALPGQDQYRGPIRSDALNYTMPILIEGNDALHAFCAWNGTDGSESNPHVISSFLVNGTNQDFGILIRDVDLHLIIKDNIIENATHFNASLRMASGILLYNVTNCIIEGNLVRNNLAGIYLIDCSNVMLMANFIHYNSYYGVGIDVGDHHTMRDNQFIECGIMVTAYVEQALSNDIDTSNTINGVGHIHYLKNLHGGLIENVENGSQVFLVNCSYVEISNLHFTASTVGLCLLFSDNNHIHHNAFVDQALHNAILLGSNNNVLSQNILDGSAYSIVFGEANNNKIIQNTISNAFIDGIVDINGTYNEISENTVSMSTQFNIKVVDSSHDVISKNTVIGSKHGIGLQWDNYNITVIRNHVSLQSHSGSGGGIETAYSDTIRITQNTLASNDVGVKIGDNSYNVVLSLNNFVNNSYWHVLISDASLCSLNESSWGNYWDNYTTRYPDAYITETNTWSEPFVDIQLSGGIHTDYHPLVYFNENPLASFRVNTTYIVTGKTAIFIFTGFSGDNPASFLWDFGDANVVSSSLHVGHVFSEAGTYSISLTVTDAHGEIDTVSVIDCIVVEENHLVVPDFSLNSTTPQVGQTVVFTYNGTHGNGLAKILWMVDGTIVHENTTSVELRFTQSGTINISVVVSDYDGDIGKHSVLIHVQPDTTVFYGIILFFSISAGITIPILFYIILHKKKARYQGLLVDFD